MASEEEKRLEKRRYLEVLRDKVFLQENLPFYVNFEEKRCNAHKLYQWQVDFFESTNRISLLTAANQIGKSSIQIIKALNLGFRPELWPRFFKRTPQMFLYYMPDSKTMDVEFIEKWVKTYLPTSNLKDHARWGWKADFEKESKKEGVRTLTLATGITIYFRQYSQLPSRLQAVTADLVLLDEECPQSHWDELMVRSQTFGLISMVFTATIGSEYLFRAMMLQGSRQELFPSAWKRMVSLYDCINYADGTPSGIYTKERIEGEIIPTYSSQAEIDKRVFGKFVKTEGLLYQEFNEQRNTCPYKVENHWRWVAGIDFGSGGKWGHASAICMIQISPCYSRARVVKTYHSGVQRITQGDLLEKYRELTKGLEVTGYFDWSATDLGELAQREGIMILKAQKSHDIGVPLLNVLFKNSQLEICVGEGSLQNQVLIQELRTIGATTPKRKRKDDAADGLRYGLSSISFRLTPLSKEEKRKAVEETHPRMRFYKGLDNADDPMREDEPDYVADGNFNLEYEDAFLQFEEII